MFACWSSQALSAPVKACEYLDLQAIADAIGSKVAKPTHSGDTQAYEGFVLHTCEWVVLGTQRGRVILTIREAPTRSLNDQGAKEIRAAPKQVGLQREYFSGLGELAEYAYWDSEDRAGITVLNGTRNVNITVMDVARFGPNNKQAFVSLARKVLAKF
jgi:hypothetical protein